MQPINSQHLQYFYGHGLISIQMYNEVYIEHRFKILSLFKICPWTGFASNPNLCLCIRPMHGHQYKTKTFHSFRQKKLFQRNIVNTVNRFDLVVYPSPRVTWPDFDLRPLLIQKQLVTAQLVAWEHFHEKQEFNVNPHNQGNSELKLSILRPNRTHKEAC